MKTLATQFDTGRAGTAVATPTCSSCCCCCCCLATVAGSSAVLAQRVNAEGTSQNLRWRRPLTILAALYWPVLAALTYFGYWTIDRLTASCYGGVNDTWNTTGASPIRCSSSAQGALIIIIPILAVGILWFLYSRVRMTHPVGRALGLTGIIVCTMFVEVVVGAMLIMAGGAGIALYVIAASIAAIAVVVRYERKLRREAEPPRATPSPFGLESWWSSPSPYPSSPAGQPPSLSTPSLSPPSDTDDVDVPPPPTPPNT